MRLIKNYNIKVMKLAYELAGRVVNDHFKDDFLIYGAKNENSGFLTYTEDAQKLFDSYYKEFKKTIFKTLK